MQLGILIIGYKNTYGIERLLSSLTKVDYCGDTDIKLIFSIDYSGDNCVENIAKEYIWNNGEKVIIAHRQNLGLRKHILSCGDYISKYNLDALIVLEDDLYVAPAMYSYAKHAIEFYKNNSRIAGISLYNHHVNANARRLFKPIYEGFDVYFLQYASSWGQIWLKDEWLKFIQWLESKTYEKLDVEKLPQNILAWKNSWLKYHIMYCISTNKYFVYPQVSLSSNFSDPGTHRKSTETSYQVPLVNRVPCKWRFCNIDDTLSVYDSFFENQRIKVPSITKPIVVDLHSKKQFNIGDLVLTTKKMSYKILHSWGLCLKPIEMNVLNNISGEGIYLYDTSIKAKNNFKDYLFEYDLDGLHILNINAIAYYIKTISRKLPIRINMFLKKHHEKNKI